MRAKQVLTLGFLAVALGVFAWFNGLPRASRASGGGPLDHYILYGIEQSTGELVRHEFATDATTTVGTVSLSDGTALTGIRGTAYIPRNSHVFGFWDDSADSNTKLVYINASTGKATVVGSSMGKGRVTGAVSAMPTASGVALAADEATPLSEIVQYNLYAVQEAEDMGFSVSSDQIVTTEPFAVRIKVLGAAVSASGVYDCPVTVKIEVGTDNVEPFGSWTLPVNGNVNDSADDEVNVDPADNPCSHAMSSVYPAGTVIKIHSKVWLKNNATDSGSSNSHWYTYRTVDTSVDTNRVIALRHGDPVPNYVAFLNQLTIRDFIESYIDLSTNTMNLGRNQVIYLIEYNNDLSSAAADFQDLVVLVTLAQDTSTLSDPDYPYPANLIQVNAKTGAKTRLMGLSKLYDGLAATSAQMFYATLGDTLYRIDPTAQTETLVGTLASASMKALEFAGSTLYRFNLTNNRVQALDTTTGAVAGSEIDPNVTGLETMVFMRSADAPTNETRYD